MLAQDVAGGQAVTVTMLSACGLELPVTSVAANQPLLQLEYDDADDVDDIALSGLAQSPAVSAGLTGTSLSYTPGGAALSAVSQLVVSFANSAAMVVAHLVYHVPVGHYVSCFKPEGTKSAFSCIPRQRLQSVPLKFVSFSDRATTASNFIFEDSQDSFDEKAECGSRFL